MPLLPTAVVQQAASNLISGAFRLAGHEVKNRAQRREMERKYKDNEGLAQHAAWTSTELPPLPPELTDFQPVRRRGPMLAEDGQPRTASAPVADGEDAGDGDAEATPIVSRTLFSDVIGHDYEKRLLRQSLRSEPPHVISVVLEGPPGTGKSLLLDDVRRTPRSLYVTGSTVKPAGLRDAFIDTEEPPQTIVFDEIDKADPETLDVLLSLLDGHVSRVVAGKPPVERHGLTVRLIGAANNTAHLSAPLRSRVVIAKLATQSEAERRSIIAEFLSRRGTDQRTAALIADAVASSGGDARDAVQIASVYESDPALADEMLTRLSRTSERLPVYGERGPQALPPRAPAAPKPKPAVITAPPLPAPPVYGVKAKTVATQPPKRSRKRRTRAPR